MNGAREFCRIFIEPEQIGSLYVLPSSHARGKTFRVFILPAGEKATVPHRTNPPTNKGTVEVYGVTGGELGWTESYGWLDKGPWEGDLIKVAADRDTKARSKKQAEANAAAKREADACEERKALLAAYSGPVSQPMAASDPSSNENSTMPQEWRDMLDRHPNKADSPMAIMDRGCITMCEKLPVFMSEHGTWSTGGQSMTVGYLRGDEDESCLCRGSSLYHIPQDEPAEESGESNGGWIEWEGGGCPVGAQQKVEFARRDGSTGVAKASKLPWMHCLNGVRMGDDVMRYRLAK